jgi:hypothetical protein
VPNNTCVESDAAVGTAAAVAPAVACSSMWGCLLGQQLLLKLLVDFLQPTLVLLLQLLLQNGSLLLLTSFWTR